MIYIPYKMATLLHEARDRAGMRLRDVHRRMNELGLDVGYEISYAVLSAKLSPSDQRDLKLNYEDLYFYCKATGDFEALDYLECCLGRVAFDVPKPGQATDFLLAEKVGKMTQKVGKWLQLVSEYMGGRSCPKEKAHQLITKGQKIIGLLMKVERHLEEKVLD